MCVYVCGVCAWCVKGFSRGEFTIYQLITSPSLCMSQFPWRLVTNNVGYQDKGDVNNIAQRDQVSMV